MGRKGRSRGEVVTGIRLRVGAAAKVVSGPHPVPVEPIPLGFGVGKGRGGGFPDFGVFGIFAFGAEDLVALGAAAAFQLTRMWSG